MAYRFLNNDLVNSISNNEAHRYVHLVKFEKPGINTELAYADRATPPSNAENYAYLTDGAFDVIFDDNSFNSRGILNGPQNYVANKVVSVGTVNETIEAKASTMNLTLAATALSAKVTSSLQITTTRIISTNLDFVQQGFSEGDTVEITHLSSSNANHELRVRIEAFESDNSIIRFTPLNRSAVASTSSYTLSFSSEEISALTASKVSTNYSSYLNREVFIYRAHLNTETGAIIGSPFLIFKGIITNGTVSDDSLKGSTISWSLTSHWGDFVQVVGRLTSDQAHRGLNTFGTTQPEALVREEYASDFGFRHADQAINIVATYQAPETRYRTKKAGGLRGALGGTNLVEYEVMVDRDVDLEFNLSAKYIPVIYGVQKVKGIPFFADGDVNDAQKVYVAQAISEGPIQSIMDIHIDGNPVICINERDNAERFDNSDAAIACFGRADAGDVLQGNLATDVNTPLDDAVLSIINAFGIQPNWNGGGSGLVNIGSLNTPIYVASNYLSAANTVSSSSTGTAGVIHNYKFDLTSPLDSSFVFHAGLKDQDADSLFSEKGLSKTFKVQNLFYADENEYFYWGPNHRVLDTAYVTTEFTIQDGEFTIPDYEFVVKGKVLDCYNYDYSYRGIGDPDLFKLGETVSLYDSSDDSLLGEVQIIDKWSFFTIEGNTDTRFRFSTNFQLEEENGVEDKKSFYMKKDSSSEKFYFLSYDSNPSDFLINEATEQVVEKSFQAKTVLTSENNPGIQLEVEIVPAPGIVGISTSVYKFTGLPANETELQLGSNLGIEITNGTSTKKYFLPYTNYGSVGGVYEVTVSEQQAAFAPTILREIRSLFATADSWKIYVTDIVKLESGASSFDDVYNNLDIKITKFADSDSSTSQNVVIQDYFGASKFAKLKTPLLYLVDDSDSYTYQILGDLITQSQEPAEAVFGVMEDKRPSINPAIQLLDYITSKRYGKGLDIEKDIDLDSFLTTARACDQRSDVTLLVYGNTPTQAQVGEVYRYPETGDLVFQGTVKSVGTISITADGDLPGVGVSSGDNVAFTQITFTNVIGKLGKKWNSYTPFKQNEIVWWEGKSFNVTSAGTITSASRDTLLSSNEIVDDVNGNNLNLYQVTANPAPKVYKVSVSTVFGVAGSGNPIVKRQDLSVGRSATSPGYSLYDSDDCKYWAYLGWDSPDQRYVTRHQTSQTVDTSTSVFNNINGMLAQFNGILKYSNGKYSLGLKTKAPEDSHFETDYPVKDISEDEIIGKVQLSDGGSKKKYNSVSATIVDPANKFSGRGITFINSDYLKEDRGVKKQANYNIPGITNYFNARMNVKQLLDESRYGLTAKFTLDQKGYLLVAGEIIRLTYSRFGWENKYFRINSLNFQSNGLVQVVADEHNEEAFIVDHIDSGRSSTTLEGGNQGTFTVSIPSVPTAAAEPTSTNRSGYIELNWVNGVGFNPAVHRTQIFRAATNLTLGDVEDQAELVAEVQTSSFLDNTDREVLSIDGVSQSTSYYYWVRHIYKKAASQSNWSKTGILSLGLGTALPITQTELENGVTLTDGGINFDEAPVGAPQIKAGLTEFDTGDPGFFLGYSSDAYKFQVGDPTGNNLQFDGTNLRLFGSEFSVTDSQNVPPSIDGVTVTGGGILLTSEGDAFFGKGDGDYFFFDQSEGTIDLSGQIISGDNILPDSITSDLIAANAIITDLIAANAIISDLIAGNSIISDLIASNAIISDKIAANSITSDLISANAVNANEIAANSINSNKISANAITTEKLAANSVKANQIAVNAVTAQSIASESITSNKIAVNAITVEKIAANAITSRTIAADAITTEKLAAEAITADKLSANSITADKIAANAVTTDKLSANSITTDKLAANSVVADNISANSVTAHQVASEAIGVEQIQAASITTDKLKASAITTDKLAANAITTDKIAANSITSDRIATNSITAEKISAGSVSTDELAANCITSDKISANSIVSKLINADLIRADDLAANIITADKIAANAITADKLAANSITADNVTANSVVAKLLTASSVTATDITTDTLSALSANMGDITAGTLKGGTIPDANTSPEGLETGAFLDLTGGKMVFGNAAKHILFDGTDLVLSGVTIDAQSVIDAAAAIKSVKKDGAEVASDIESLNFTTGIQVTSANGEATIFNDAPDQTVVLNEGENITISGTYPEFTIASSKISQVEVEDIVGGMVSGNTETDISVTYDTVNNKLNFVNSAPDQVVTLTGAGKTSVSGTYPDFTITSTGLTVEEVQDVVGAFLVTPINSEGFNISYDDANDVLTLTNTLPDQVVTLTGAGKTSVSGTYPDFTITSTGLTSEEVQDEVAAFVQSGTGINIVYDDVNNDLTITNSAPDQVVTLTGDTNIDVTGTYPNFTISTALEPVSAEEVQDEVAGMFTQNVTHTDISVTYNDEAGKLVLVNSAPDQTVVLNEGSNVTITGEYPSFTISSTDTNTEYTTATSTALGLVKIGYTENAKNYPVELDAEDKMFVNVPWTDTIYSGWNIAASGTAGTSQITSGNTVTFTGTGSTTVTRSGDDITIDSTNTEYTTATDTVLGLVKIGYTENAKNYPVELDVDDKMFVNVPWADTNDYINSATFDTGTGVITFGYQGSPSDISVDLDGRYAQNSVGYDSSFRTVTFADLEKTNVTADGQLGFDSSQGLIIYRGSETSATTILDGFNISAGSGISISNLGAGGTAAEKYEFSVSGLTTASFDASVILESGETFSDSDTVLMSAAAIDDLIISKNYTTSSGVADVGAGDGLTGGGTTAAVTLNVGQGDGISVTADAIAVDSTVVRTSGAQTIGGEKTFSSNVTVSGNLTVSGTTTIINTEQLDVADNIIKLNSNYTGSTPSESAGLEVERGTVDNALFQWKESNVGITGDLDAGWSFGTHRVEATGFYGTFYGDGSAITGVTASALEGLSTADVPEDPSATVSSGTMYFTNGRARDAIGAGDGLTKSVQADIGVLNIGEGDGITVNADDIQVDNTVLRTTTTFSGDISGTYDNLTIAADFYDGRYYTKTISDGRYLRADADSDFTGTIKGTSDQTNPVLIIDGAGPNIVRFLDDGASVTGVDLVYRTSANTLGFEKSTDGSKLWETDVDTGITTFNYTPSAFGNTIWHEGNDGDGSGLDADLLDGSEATDFVKKAESSTITGNLTLDNSGAVTNTSLTVISNDGAISTIAARGSSQGTGRVFVGQSANFGGGIEYNGDGAPAIASGATADRVALFRVDAGVYHWTAQNPYNSNNWEFREDVTVNGLLTATQKSFTIDHPTKEGYKLRHGSLEGPENGVYIRGRLNGTNTIEFPEYWKGLVHEDSITVNLTSIGKESSWVEELQEDRVIVGGNLNCFYIIFAERKDVDRLVVEYESNKEKN